MIFELTLILSAVLSASPVQAPTAPGTVELRWQVGGKASASRCDSKGSPRAKLSEPTCSTRARCGFEASRFRRSWRSSPVMARW